MRYLIADVDYFESLLPLLFNDELRVGPRIVNLANMLNQRVQVKMIK
jgi:hypothetical protein